MCTNPISIPNPDFQGQGLSIRYKKKCIDAEGEQYTVSAYKQIRPRSDEISKITDSAFSRKLVPCGTCEQCLAKRQLQWVQRCLEASRNHHVLFCTNTYSDEMIPRLQVGNRLLTYVRWDDFDESLIRSARDHYVFGREFKYLACSEYGDKRHRAHIHYLLFIPIRPDDPKTYIFQLADIWTKHMFRFWSRNTSTSRKNPVRIPCSAFIRRYYRNSWHSTYDVQPVVASAFQRRLFADAPNYKDDELNVSFYVTKYVLKFDPYVKKLQQWLRQNLDDNEYHKTWLKLKPQVHTSKNFGVSDETAQYISTSLDEVLNYGVHTLPMYVLPDGRVTPLSRYYMDSKPRKTPHRYISNEQQFKFFKLDKNAIPGTMSRYFEPLDEASLNNIKQKHSQMSFAIRNNSLDL